MRDELQRFVSETLGEESGIGVVDETGFLKKGDCSVGVQRQYTGTAGKVENCQIGVFLSYASCKGHTFLDRRLYLPKGWCQDAERWEKAKVPEQVVFRSKPQLAIEMLQNAWTCGVPMRWVSGDEVYGNATALRDAVAGGGRLYVLAVSINTPVWVDQKAKPRPGVPHAMSLTTVGEVVAGWPAQKWHRLTVAEGEKGPRVYDWGRARVMESRDGRQGPSAWLLARRSPTDPEDLAYYLSNAPSSAPLRLLARVAATRYTVEQCFEEGKGESGLDQYEVRHWHSWYRHITLSMMAHAWLASLRSDENKKNRRTIWPP